MARAHLCKPVDPLPWRKWGTQTWSMTDGLAASQSLLAVCEFGVRKARMATTGAAAAYMQLEPQECCSLMQLL